MEFREGYIAAVRLYATNGQFHILASYLRSKVRQPIGATVDDLIELWNRYDTEEYTLPKLGILLMRCTAFESSFATSDMMQWCKEFVDRFKPAVINFVPDLYFQLWHVVTELLTNRNQASAGIHCLRQAIVRLLPSLSMLTPIHGDLFQLCLKGKILKPALPFLEHQITSVYGENCEESKVVSRVDESKVFRIDHTATFDSRYYLLYCYYGGCIYAALRRFRDALFMFELAITTPSERISAITVQAHKKWQLTSLIVRGSVTGLPINVPRMLQRYMASINGPYKSLAQAYEAENVDELKQVALAEAQTFHADGNAGLINQLQVDLLKNKISTVAKLYNEIALTQLVELTGMSSVDEVEKILFSMAADDLVQIRLDQCAGTVKFIDAVHTQPIIECVKNQIRKLEMTYSIVKTLRSYIDAERNGRKKSAEEPRPLQLEDEGMCDSASGSKETGEEQLY